MFKHNFLLITYIETQIFKNNNKTPRNVDNFVKMITLLFQ